MKSRINLKKNQNGQGESKILNVDSKNNHQQLKKKVVG